jgi:hypothetical protein
MTSLYAIDFKCVPNFGGAQYLILNVSLDGVNSGEASRQFPEA